MDTPPLQQFICFARLPTALRLYIWELAVQNHYAEPETHFFHVYGRCGQRKADFRPLHWPPDWDEEAQGTHIGPWRPPGDGAGISWTNAQNLSGYLRDVGIWNACGESRMIMAQRFKKLAPEDVEAWGGFTTQVVRDGERCHWITVHPLTDLFIYQIPDAHFNDEFYCAADLAFDGGVLKIGIEYEPQWAYEFDRADLYDRLYEDHSSSFGRLIGQIKQLNYTSCGWLSEPNILYFVDYNLRPVNWRYANMDLVRKRLVYVARGRRYIEVQIEDLNGFREPREGNSWEDAALGLFMEELLKRLWVLLEDHSESSPGPPPHWPPSIRVLGCLTEGLE